MTHYPGIQSSTVERTIESIIHSAQRMSNEGAVVEFEVRFGKANSTFVPGMTVETMNRIEKQLNTCRDWSTTTEDWSLSMLFYHGSTIPGDTRILRTESSYHSATSKEVRCIEKRSVQTHTYIVDVVDHLDAVVPIDFRLAVSLENPVPDVDVPMSVQPSKCTIRLRKEYCYTPLGYARPVWAYMLTKRWTASGFHEALLMKETEPPQCDIELEIVDINYLTNTNADELSFKLMWKIYDLIKLIADTELRSDEFSYRLHRTR